MTEQAAPNNLPSIPERIKLVEEWIEDLQKNMATAPNPTRLKEYEAALVVLNKTLMHLRILAK